MQLAERVEIGGPRVSAGPGVPGTVYSINALIFVVKYTVPGILQSILKNPLSINPPGDDVVKSTSCVDSDLSGHNKTHQMMERISIL